MRTNKDELMNDIVEFIDKKYQESEKIPSIREIADGLNIPKSSIARYLNEMTEKGIIENNGGFRGIRTSNMAKIPTNLNAVPVVGAISCGPTIFAEQNIEDYLYVPNWFLGSGKHFVLRAFGNSMINAGIEEGDQLFIRAQSTAEEGQIVVARIGDEATLKRFYIDREKGKIRLHPENDAMEDMFFDEIDIQGIVVKSVKDFT